MLHANMLRRWHSPSVKKYRVTVAHEEEGNRVGPSNCNTERLNFTPSSEQHKLLDNVLQKFSSMICDVPECTDRLTLSITMGDHQPISFTPYRIPLKRRDGAKHKIDKLLELGLIRPSYSPWVSPIVAVGKPDAPHFGQTHY